NSYQVGIVTDPLTARVPTPAIVSQPTVVAVTNTGASTGAAPEGLCINAYATNRDTGNVVGCYSCPMGTNQTRRIAVYGDIRVTNPSSSATIPFAVELVSTKIEGPTSPCHPGTAGSANSPLANGMAASLYTQAAFTGNSTPILRSLIPSTLTQQTLSKLTAAC